MYVSKPKYYSERKFTLDSEGGRTLIDESSLKDIYININNVESSVYEKFYGLHCYKNITTSGEVYYSPTNWLISGGIY